MAAEGPVSAAACSVLAALRGGGSASCETLAAGRKADGTAAGRGLAVARTDAACRPASWGWTVGTHGSAGVAVGLDPLGLLPGDRAGLVGDGAGRCGDRAGLVGDGVALLVADGVGEGIALVVADGVGDGVVVDVADGVGDAVAVGVPDGAGDGSALGVVVEVADGVGDGVIAEADSEGLGTGDALAGAAAAAPAMMTPRTARTAVRAPTNISPPGAWRPRHTMQAITKPLYSTRTVQSASHVPLQLSGRIGAACPPGLAFLTDAERV